MEREKVEQTDAGRGRKERKKELSWAPTSERSERVGLGK